MSFWGTEGYSAGPFHYPARPGIFDRILSGVNVALKLGDLYQGYQTHAATRENQNLEGLQKQIGIAQTLNPEQGTAPSEGMQAKASKAGITLPKMIPPPKQSLEDLVTRRAREQGMDPIDLFKTIKGKQQRPLVTKGGVLDWQGNKIADIPEEDTTFVMPDKSILRVPGSKNAKQWRESPGEAESQRIGVRENSPLYQNYQLDPSGLKTPLGPGKMHSPKETIIGDPNAAPGTTYPGNVKFPPQAKDQQGTISETTKETPMGKETSTTTKKPIKETKPPASRPAPGGTAQYTGKNDTQGRPLYQLPDGSVKAWRD